MHSTIAEHGASPAVRLVRRAAPALCLLSLGTIAARDAGADPTTKGDDKQVCIASSEQGQTQRDDGKYRAARASFLNCTRDACPRVIVQSCTKWLRELDESAPTVVLSAKDEDGNDLTDVKVTFDGEPFAAQLDGNPIEADTGEHILHFEREGSVPVEQKLLLRAGEKARVIRVVMKPVAAPEPEASASASAAPTEAPPPPPPPEGVMSAHHVVAGGLGIGALAALGVGIGTLVASGHAKNDAASLRASLGGDATACSGSGVPACQSLNNKVHSEFSDRNLSTGFFIGAGALAAGAIVAWFVWPKSGGAPPSEPATSGAILPLRGGAAATVSGSF